MINLNIKKYASLFSTILLGVCICMLPIYLIINYTYNTYLLERMNNITETFNRLNSAHKEQSLYIQHFLEIHNEEIVLFEQTENKLLSESINDTVASHKQYILNDTTLTNNEKDSALQQLKVIETEYKRYVHLFRRLNQLNKYYTEQMLELQRKNK